ncbi:LD-carboxypeptidase [Streptomyces sp. NPDC006798]|uniref:LD-carboxypeptidase n=1 Tax=Streptomyces sp. NPDC006798 TaxID=3155462 RepID=UPI0033C2B0F4
MKRFRLAVEVLESRGYEVVGSCMDGTRHVSAPAGRRAEELTELLTDPSIRAVVPPWGGETAIDLLSLLDFGRLRAAEPTWFVGSPTCRHCSLR